MCRLRVTVIVIALHLQTILGNLKVLRAATSRVGKEYAARGSNSSTAQEAKDLLLEGMAELEQLYEHSVSTCMEQHVSDNLIRCQSATHIATAHRTVVHHSSHE